MKAATDTICGPLAFLQSVLSARVHEMIDFGWYRQLWPAAFA
jgi:hypothetical protein